MASLRSTVALKTGLNHRLSVEKTATTKPAHVRSRRTGKVTCSTQSPVQTFVAGIVERSQEVAKIAVAGVAATAFVVGSANALTYNEFQNLTYSEVKGTGIANTCPVMEGDAGELKLKAGEYKVSAFCMEPTSFTVKEDPTSKFMDTKLMTRLTYTLDQIDADMTIGSDGSLTFKEQDGLDYAAVTVQLPGGERVPFLFSMKQLVAKGTTAQFGGDFNVPSYRGSSFLDPKGRGGSTGYDTTVSLPAAGDDESIKKENIKSIKALKGSAVFNVAKFDAETGEFAGVFESIQPSDTDLGSKDPKDIKITGLWYGRIKMPTSA